MVWDLNIKCLHESWCPHYCMYTHLSGRHQFDLFEQVWSEHGWQCLLNWLVLWCGIITRYTRTQHGGDNDTLYVVKATPHSDSLAKQNAYTIILPALPQLQYSTWPGCYTLPNGIHNVLHVLTMTRRNLLVGFIWGIHPTLVQRVVIFEQEK